MFQLKKFSRLKSSNLYCKRNWKKLPHHSVIVANEQTAGYGTLEKNGYHQKRKTYIVAYLSKIFTILVILIHYLSY